MQRSRIISFSPRAQRIPQHAHPRVCEKTDQPFHAITTELEHNSVLRPLTTLEEDGRLSLSIVPFKDARVSLDEIKKAIRPDTRLVVMTHGSNVLGSVQNIRPIAEYFAANDIFFIIDGAQTAGHIPVNLSEIPAGAFVFTGHKALFGIPGIGGFYLPEPGRNISCPPGGYRHGFPLAYPTAGHAAEV